MALNPKLIGNFFNLILFFKLSNFVYYYSHLLQNNPPPRVIKDKHAFTMYKNNTNKFNTEKYPQTHTEFLFC